jgi:hypothetical protein
MNPGKLTKFYLETRVWLCAGIEFDADTEQVTKLLVDDDDCVILQVFPQNRSAPISLNIL